MIHKRQFRLNDAIAFDLGDKFLILDETDDEGNRKLSLVTGPDKNEKGETLYRFDAKVDYAETDGENHYVDKGCPEGTAMLDALMENNRPNARFLRVKGEPAAQLLTLKTPLNFGGIIIKMYGMSIQVPITSNRLVSLVAVKAFSDDPDENLVNYQDMLDAAKTIRVHSKPLDLKNISASSLMEALMPEFEDEEEGFINLKLGVKLKVGDDEAQQIGSISYNRDGSTDFEPTEDNDFWDDDDDENWDEDDDLWDYPIADPDEYLYTHYGRLKREHDRLSGFGTVIINGQGTDFQPLDLLELLENTGNKSAAFYKDIKAVAVEPSPLRKQIALTMAEVFRVEKWAFNEKHDREVGIREGMYEKKYMLSALRSFAWTLAQKADDDGREITDYDFEALSELGEFIEAREWLNYEGGSWFDGLCGHSDIHVIYAPQSVFDKKQDAALSRALNNNPVCSLDALRKDLDALKGVMAVVYNGLRENRDRSEALSGPLADVLNAWCALCVAAQRPFFSEDGPSMHFYSYPEEPLHNYRMGVPTERVEIQKGEKATETSAPAPTERMKLEPSPDGREHFTMGTYRQTGKSDPIEWMVLKKESGRALALSVRALDARAFGGNSWEDSEIRKWLNGDFYKSAFSADEKAAILAESIPNSKVTSDKTKQAEADTTDRIFLLHADEALSLLPTARDRIAKATPHAKQSGAEISGGPDQCHWWLRGPGFMMWAARIQANGEGNRWGIYAGEVCVRPAMWVDLSRFEGGAVKEVPVEEKAEKTVKSTDKSADVKPGKTAYIKSSKTASAKPSKSALNQRVIPSDLPPEYVLRIDGVEKLPEDAYKDRDDFYVAIIGSSVKEMPSSVFAYCENLRVIVLTGDYEYVGDSTFYLAYGCSRLEKIVIPRSVYERYSDHYSELSNSCEIAVMEPEATDAEWKKAQKCSFRTPQMIEALVKKGYTLISSDSNSVGKEEYKDRLDLEKIVFAEGIEEIEESAFEGCTNLQEVLFPSSLKLIDEGAFRGCPLNEIVLPQGFHNDLCDECFFGSRPRRIVFPRSSYPSGRAVPFDYESLQSVKTVEFYPYEFEEYATKCPLQNWLYSVREKVHIHGMSDAERDALFGKVSIISTDGTLKTNDAQELETREFRGRYDVERVIIPEGVKRINSQAFKYCTNLREIVLPSTLVSIDFCAFSDCANLCKVELPAGVGKIDSFAFRNCTSLSEITLPNSLQSIKEGVFDGCDSLKRLVIPKNVKKLPAVLVSSNSLEEVVLPDGVVELEREGSLMFRRCPNLKRIYVSEAFNARFKDTRFVRGYGKLFVIDAAPEKAQPPKPKKKKEPEFNPNAARIKELQQRVGELEAQRDSIGGLFAGMKRRKIQKEIDALKVELDSLHSSKTL